MTYPFKGNMKMTFVAYMITVVIKVFHGYENQTFFFTF